MLCVGSFAQEKSVNVYAGGGAPSEAVGQGEQVLQELLGRTNRLLAFDTTRILWKTMRPTVLLLNVYSVPRKRLPSRFLATIWIIRRHRAR
jgi:hypothetical protein